MQYIRIVHITLFYKFLFGGNQVDDLSPVCKIAEGFTQIFCVPTFLVNRVRKLEILEDLALTFDELQKGEAYLYKEGSYTHRMSAYSLCTFIRVQGFRYTIF